MDNNERDVVELQKKKRKKFSAKFLKSAAVVLVVFSLGFLAGQSDISNIKLFSRSDSSTDSSLPNKLDYRGVEEIYKSLKNSFDGQLNQQDLENGLKQGLVKAVGDPYTEFLDEEATKDFEEGLSGSFEGIGAELGKDKESIVIISPIQGFPAEKAGLKARDIIVEIDGESTHDLSITEAVKKIRGPKGTAVKLKILRGNETIDFEIIRDQITIPSVTSEVVEPNIGVIKISRFGDDTVELAMEAAANLKSKNVAGIILDLRGNPGGLLEGAVDIAELWLPEGSTVLQEKRGGEIIKTYFASGKQPLGGLKTVVLIDGGSASASEIVAGALKDNQAAFVIGAKSYGKGSVQEVKRLDFGGSLKVTIARWFTPNGRNIDKEGIEPDRKVEISDEDIKASRDPQKAAAIEFLKSL